MIANWRASCLSQIDDGSFKCLKRCSWQRALMTLNGSIDIPWCYLALLWHSILSWKLPTCAQAVYPQQIRDPSNIFKDAVDGLFQAIMMGLNGSNKVPWQSLPFIRLSFLSWQLPSRTQAVYPWYMQDPLNVFKDAVGGLFQGAVTALNGSHSTFCPSLKTKFQKRR